MALKVGIIRDDRYLLHQPGLVHPESRQRLIRIYEMLDKEHFEALVPVQPTLASLEELELVHAPNYVRKVLKTAERPFSYLAPDTPVSSESYLSASLAVGGCIRGLQAVLSGRCDVCFALIRPPGHHALRNRASGFCIFNNLAITARYAIKRQGLRRVLIVDWDIHHGNGIQDLFYQEKEVLYLSTHYRGWYPQTGAWEETGAGEGAGYTINVPLPKDIHDEDMLYVCAELLGRVMQSYRPELILVAAGFDAHYMDPIGRLQLTEKFFGGITELILDFRSELGSPPLLFALEGGYNVIALERSVKEVFDVLTSRGVSREKPFAVSEIGVQLLDKARSVHRQFHLWTD